MPILPLAGLFLAVTQSPAAEPARDPLQWSWRLKRGEVLRYRVTRDQGMEFHADSLHRQGSQIVTETFTLTVEDVAADGTARVQITLDVLFAREDRDDGLGSEYDSEHPPERYSDGEMHFGEHAAEIGKTRTATIAPDGTFVVAPAAPRDAASTDYDPEEDSLFEYVGWACILPEAARLPRNALEPDSKWTSRQRFEAIFALEHGLFPWPILADVAVRPDGSARVHGIDCARLELAPRFSLATDESGFAEGVAEKRILAEPSAGKGSMLVSTADGVLASFELEGSLDVYVALEDGQVATRASPRMEFRNRLAVELLERRPPPR